MTERVQTLPIRKFLENMGLVQYLDMFLIRGYDRETDITSLDENDLDTMLISDPDHRHQILQAVTQLQKEQVGDCPTEDVLACGRWKKPATLSDAKFDFLVVDASIYSTKESSKYRRIEFMVDTGSDVTTIRQEVLDELDLEILGRIHSKGVHGSKTTTLYKAKILIGNQEMEIEVMGESYDSLGSRVVRHFRHYVDGKHHVWLRGNFCDEDSKLCQTAKYQALNNDTSHQSDISESFNSAIASQPRSPKVQDNQTTDSAIHCNSTSKKRKRTSTEEDGVPSKMSSTTYLHVSPDELDL
ncbi:uncharacterized protein LOC133172293 isoform X2 [Saccostrea echinata]|uniref:uncharacterized protein LOC133172293 isoform X2 n=1 Tax=Saccostrea echinata TaxID=191078 RepID=UPI002A7FC9C1|nr:uncharacterized protein LOC133172293 isoform X2 [Saccostrea echinata]